MAHRNRKRGLQGFVSSVGGAVAGNFVTILVVAGVGYWGFKRLGGAAGISDKVKALVARAAGAVTPAAPVNGYAASRRGVRINGFGQGASEQVTRILADQGLNVMPNVETDPYSVRVARSGYDNNGGLGAYMAHTFKS